VGNFGSKGNKSEEGEVIARLVSSCDTLPMEADIGLVRGDRLMFLDVQLNVSCRSKLTSEEEGRGQFWLPLLCISWRWKR